MTLAELRNRFERLMVSERHRALTQWGFEWSMKYARNPDPERYLKEAFLSSTFEVFCAPTSALWEESCLSMKFLFIFFKADDASPADLEEFLRRIDTTKVGTQADLSGELEECYDELIGDFRQLERDSEDFCSALRTMCSCMLIEKRADKAQMTETEFQRLRTHTVGVPSYAHCWRTIRGIYFAPKLAEAIERSMILNVAAEIVYLANDIGSLQRDEAARIAAPNDADPNMVLLRMRLLGDRDAAINDVVQRHNAKIAEFCRTERDLRESQHGSDPALHSFIDILRCTVDGDLATTKHLIPLRYNGTATYLSLLMTTAPSACARVA